MCLDIPCKIVYNKVAFFVGILPIDDGIHPRKEDPMQTNRRRTKRNAKQPQAILLMLVLAVL
jgi:hypothetical protein